MSSEDIYFDGKPYAMPTPPMGFMGIMQDRFVPPKNSQASPEWITLLAILILLILIAIALFIYLYIQIRRSRKRDSSRVKDEEGWLEDPDITEDNTFDLDTPPKPSVTQKNIQNPQEPVGVIYEIPPKNPLEVQSINDPNPPTPWHPPQMTSNLNSNHMKPIELVKTQENKTFVIY